MSAWHWDSQTRTLYSVLPMLRIEVETIYERLACVCILGSTRWWLERWEA